MTQVIAGESFFVALSKKQVETYKKSNLLLKGGEKQMIKKCKACKAEIPNDAKKCSHCSADQRNWAGRHPILTGIFILIVVFIVIGAIGSSSKSGSSSGTGSSVSSDKGAVSVKSAKVGDTVNDGDLAFTVQSMDNAQTIGNSFDQKTAQGTYYILTVKIQNNGKDTKTINASDFNIVDSQGRKYDYSTDGQTAMEMSDGGTSFFLQQIQPSLSVTGKIVFDVPASATGLKLMAQGDIFSTPVSIDLGK